MAQGVREGSATHYLALQMSHDLSRKACRKAAERLGKVTLRPGRVGAGQVGKGLTAGGGLLTVLSVVGGKSFLEGAPG